MDNEKTHPIKMLLDQIWGMAHTPRLVIDASRDDVILPAHVKAKWGEKLVIDLDAGYPMKIVFDEKGIHADLAFSGHVSRCTMPWARIYSVIDRDTGAGVAIPAHAPSANGKDVSKPPTGFETSFPFAEGGFPTGKVTSIAGARSSAPEKPVARGGLRLIKGGKA